MAMAAAGWAAEATATGREAAAGDGDSGGGLGDGGDGDGQGGGGEVCGGGNTCYHIEHRVSRLADLAHSRGQQDRLERTQSP